MKILTLQNPVNAGLVAAPFGIAPDLLKVVRLTDFAITLHGSEHPPILHDIDLDDEKAFQRFMFEASVPLGDEAMTCEVEAR